MNCIIANSQFNSLKTIIQERAAKCGAVIKNEIKLSSFLYRYETLTSAESRQKQSKSTGDLFDMVSTMKLQISSCEICFRLTL